MIDYTSTGISRTHETFIPIQAKAALEAYVMKELSMYGTIPVSRYPIYEKKLSEELAKLRMLEFNFTAFSDAVYETIVTSVYR